MKYLVVYNAVSTVLWGCVLLRALILYPLVGPDFVSEGMAEFTAGVQAIAILEVVHALVGLVRAPVLTTAMQVASRLAVIFGVVLMFPSSAACTAFTTMVVAWGITETIRYPFYWASLSGGVPNFLKWARYNLFIVLYPLGASSEAILIFRALPQAQLLHPYYNLFLKALLLIYPPSFYVLYMHMWAQRSKVLKQKNKNH